MKNYIFIYWWNNWWECDPNADVIQEDIKPKSFMALLSKNSPI